MEKRVSKLVTVSFGLCMIAIWSVSQTACEDERSEAESDDDDDNDNDDDNNDNDNDNNDDNNDDDNDTADDDDDDTGGDTDTDSDSDTDSDECVPPEWGSGFNVGQPVANWSLSAIYDQDGDGEISGDETEEKTVTLEDIYCSGVNSLAIYIHDGD